MSPTEEVHEEETYTCMKDYVASLSLAANVNGPFPDTFTEGDEQVLECGANSYGTVTMHCTKDDFDTQGPVYRVHVDCARCYTESCVYIKFKYIFITGYIVFAALMFSLIFWYCMYRDRASSPTVPTHGMKE